MLHFCIRGPIILLAVTSSSGLHVLGMCLPELIVIYKITKRYVSITKYIYYHIGVKMDYMFQPSSGHHQVQYKEMWGSTEVCTRMGT